MNDVCTLEFPLTQVECTRHCVHIDVYLEAHNKTKQHTVYLYSITKTSLVITVCTVGCTDIITGLHKCCEYCTCFYGNKINKSYMYQQYQYGHVHTGVLRRAVCLTLSK